jgi:hypothetical protein
MAETEFDRLVVARHSPQNKCLGPEGAVLVLASRLPAAPREGRRHYFVDVATQRLRNNYAWVRRVSPFTLTSFVAEHWIGECSAHDMCLLELMLNAVSRLDEDKAVAPSYGKTGFPNWRLELRVHRMFFFTAARPERAMPSAPATAGSEDT